MAEFDPSKLNQAKESAGEFNPDKFDKYKAAIYIPPPPPPESVMDRAKRHLVDASFGFSRGALRQGQPPGPGSTMSSRVGYSLGKDLGPTTGMIGALALAPTGIGIPAAAAIAGAGGAAGEAVQLGAAKAAGGKTPKTAGSAINDIASEGLKSAAAELGLRWAGKAAQFAKDLVPEAAFAILKMPVEAVKRAMERPFIIMGGPEAKAMVERNAVRALEGVQNALGDARKVVGDKVGEALEALHVKTGGAKIFDLSGVVKNTKEYMQQVLQTADPVVQKLAGGDLAKINGILDSMVGEMKEGAAAGEAALKDIKTINQIKKSIQGLVDYTKRGAPEIQSDLGEDVLKHMGRQIRDVIEKVAADTGDTALKKANTEAKAIYDLYDEVRPLIKTGAKDAKSMLLRINGIAADFNAGGLRQQLIESLKAIPKAAKHVDDLMDAVASRAFTEHAALSPSSTIVGMFRSLATPKRLGQAIKAGSAASATLGQPVKTLSRAGVMAAAPTPNVAQILGSQAPEQK